MVAQADRLNGPIIVGTIWLAATICLLFEFMHRRTVYFECNFRWMSVLSCRTKRNDAINGNNYRYMAGTFPSQQNVHNSNSYITADSRKRLTLQSFCVAVNWWHILQNGLQSAVEVTIFYNLYNAISIICAWISRPRNEHPNISESKTAFHLLCQLLLFARRTITSIDRACVALVGRTWDEVKTSRFLHRIASEPARKIKTKSKKCNKSIRRLSKITLNRLPTTSATLPIYFEIDGVFSLSSSSLARSLQLTTHWKRQPAVGGWWQQREKRLFKKKYCLLLQSE